MNKKNDSLDLNNSKKYLESAQTIFVHNIALLNEPRLLVRVLENIFFCFDSCLDILIKFELGSNNSQPMPINFDSKLSFYNKNIQNKYNLDLFFSDILREVHEFYVFHKKSPIEFVCHDNFVICSNDYHYKLLTFSQLEFYLSKAKIFIAEIDSIISN
jgi:hypothetical protein